MKGFVDVGVVVEYEVPFGHLENINYSIDKSCIVLLGFAEKILIWVEEVIALLNMSETETCSLH
jgi:hypothetical protein